MNWTRIAFITLLSSTQLACSDTSEVWSAAQSGNDKLTTSTPISVVTDTFRDKKGNILEIQFDNTAYTATANFNDTIIKLEGQPAASGIWYANDEYDLRGKGGQVRLTKYGVLLFEN